MPKKVLSAFLSVLIVVGILMTLWPVGQTVYANWNQNQLRAQWDKEKSSAPKTSRNAKIPTAKTAPAKPLKAAWPQTRLVIPNADVDVIVLSGWDEKTLSKAPGHWPSSALPGQVGNCSIAGHRNIYGSPFYKVDTLQPGAPIQLQTPTATYLYRVIEVKAVGDADTSVLKPSSEPSMASLLTLVTCTIPRTANRIIVSANLESVS
jgi:LPXTG-site transpeptidase (sortase) family protein